MMLGIAHDALPYFGTLSLTSTVTTVTGTFIAGSIPAQQQDSEARPGCKTLTATAAPQADSTWQPGGARAFVPPRCTTLAAAPPQPGLCTHHQS